MNYLRATLAGLLLLVGSFCLGGVDVPHFKLERALAATDIGLPLMGTSYTPSGGGAPTWNPNSTQAPMVNQGYGAGATFNVTLDATPAAADLIFIALYNDQPVFVYFAGITETNSGKTATFVYDSLGNSSPTASTGGELQIWELTGVTNASLVLQTNETGGGVLHEGVIVGVLKNLTSLTSTAKGFGPTSAQADPQTLTGAITVPSAGFGIVAMSTDYAGPNSPTSTNSTFSTGMNIGISSNALFSFYQVASGSWNPSITGHPSTSYAASLVAAAWH